MQAATPWQSACNRGEGRFPRGRCEPILGRYFRHLTAMDSGNAGIVGNTFRPWRKTLASTCPRTWL